MDYSILIEISVRTLLSMIIGGVIGWERESTHRPAGLRTHMLVAIGACVVMQLGSYTASHLVGDMNTDPSRLGAQVISGIGFLGAGTIMKEGATIKGLTTAASLWVVACLGLAVGCGAYIIAITGFVAVILTLTIFEHASTFIPGGKYTRFSITVQCKNGHETLNHLNDIAAKHHANLSELQLNVFNDQLNEISFNLTTHQSRRTLDATALLEDLSHDSDITAIKMTEY